MELKAICEMTKDELASELLYCLRASEEDVLSLEERSHYRRRAEVVKQYMIECGAFPLSVINEVESLV